MSGLPKLLSRQARQLAEGQRKLANLVRTGPVVAINPAKGRVKIDLGDADNPLPTPWIRWVEHSGDRSTWNPPTMGEDMMVISTSGEIDENSRAVHGGFTDQNPAPSGNGDALVFKTGAVTAEIRADGITGSVGGVRFEASAAGFKVTGPFEVVGDVTFSGGSVTHNGVDIGATHKHKDTQPGAGQSGVPV